ncbi:MAG: HlyD family secretion protein [Bacteroidota bacterium]
MKRIRILLMALSLGFLGCSPGDDEQVIASGTLEATEVTVSAEVTGKVLELRIEEGSNVASDDTLAILDYTDYVLQLRQAEAALGVADAHYRIAKKGPREEDIQAAEQLLRQSEAQLENAERDYGRMKELFEAQSITKKQLDDAETKYLVGQAQFRSARENYQKLKTGFRTEEVDAARAQRDQANAQVDLIKEKIADCFITVPIAGTVTHRFVEIGELVIVGSSVARVANLDQMNLWIYVPEQEVAKVQLNQPIDVRIDAYPEKSYAGQVVFISADAEFTPKNIQTKDERIKLVFGVKIKVENPGHELKSGLPADATIRFVGTSQSE